MNGLSIAHLMGEHRATEKVLTGLEGLITAPLPWGAEAMAAYGALCLHFNRAVTCHIRKEDEALFPLLEEYLPRDVGPLAVLRGEHAEIANQYALMRHAGDALRLGTQNASAAEDFARYGRRLLLMIQDHIYKEDRVLYPMVVRLLSEEQDRKVLAHMDGIAPLGSSADGE